MLRWLLWGVGILILLAAVLAVVFLHVRLGVRAVWTETEQTIWIQFGPFRKQVTLGKGKASAPETPQKKPPPSKPKKREKHRRVSGLTWSDWKDAWKQLSAPLFQTLQETRQELRIFPLKVSAVLGGQDDPAETAQQYGRLHALVWTVLPALEQLIDIPAPQIHFDINFDTPKTTLTGEIGASLPLKILLVWIRDLWGPMTQWYEERTHQQTGKDEQNGDSRGKEPAPAEHPDAVDNGKNS